MVFSFSLSYERASDSACFASDAARRRASLDAALEAAEEGGAAGAFDRKRSYCASEGLGREAMTGRMSPFVWRWS